jgi:hypothetical protein
VVFLEDKIREMTKKDLERENEIKNFKVQSQLVSKDIQTKHD